MGKFGCRCGTLLSNVSSPATHEGFLITDVDWDGSPELTDAFDIPHRNVIECHKCRRLYIEIEPGTNRWTSYLPEGEPLQLDIKQGGYRG